MRKAFGFIIIISIAIPICAAAQAPDTLWIRTYGGESDEESWSLTSTPDNGLAILGYTPQGLTLIRMNEDGGIIWTQDYNYPTWNLGMSVVSLEDGFIISTGRNVIFKTDQAGNEIWHSQFGNVNIRSARPTGDGGFIAAGYGNGDMFMAKTDSLGGQIWSRYYSGKGDERAWDAAETPGRIYIPFRPGRSERGFVRLSTQ